MVDLFFSSGGTEFEKTVYKVGPPNDSVQLVQITPISLWFMVPITIVNGVYKPSNITGGPHIVPPINSVANKEVVKFLCNCLDFGGLSLPGFNLCLPEVREKQSTTKVQENIIFNQ